MQVGAVACVTNLAIGAHENQGEDRKVVNGEGGKEEKMKIKWRIRKEETRGQGKRRTKALRKTQPTKVS